MNTIVDLIQNNILKIVDHPAFREWEKEWNKKAKGAPGDIVLINNSFIYRGSGLKTTKSKKYIGMLVNKNREIILAPVVATMKNKGINNDIKEISRKAAIFPSVKSLEDSVKAEMERLGLIIFILISSVEDTKIFEVPFKSNHFNSITWDPKKRVRTSFKRKYIYIKDIQDEQSIWEDIENYYAKHSWETSKNMKDEFIQSIEQLRSEAFAYLVFPEQEGDFKKCLTDSIINVLKNQCKEYKKYLKETKVNANNLEAHNEILRIAYNFAGDALKYLQLVVSICDLKPIVMWGTLYEHFALADAFRDLPWTKSKYKPSLASYAKIIGDARNKAFHKIFPLEKTLKVKLPETAFQESTLTLFSEFTNKKNNTLDFSDKELVDVLLDFTRTNLTSVPTGFWDRNLVVMESATELLEKTCEFLKMLYQKAKMEMIEIPDV